jgi:hypothetical protein
MPSYTAVGGTTRGASTGLSAVLLNRGGRYPRRTLFKELEKVGFDYIISLEGPQDRYDLEELSGRFPFVRFIILRDSISPGEQINLAVSELTSPLFFVIWNDLRVLHGGDAAKIMDWFQLSTEEIVKAPSEASKFRRLCTVPVIQNSHLEMLPTLIAPALFRGTVKTLRFPPQGESQPSLYPFDGVGIYDRDRFVQLGGFDGTIKSPYWQLMDFGFRAHLWGEEIRCTQLVRLSYDGEAGAENNTADGSYRRFYLKNLAPSFRKDSAHIPLGLFPVYLFKTGGDPFTAWRDFIRSRQWVKTNRYRFRRDARMLTNLWEGPASSEAELEEESAGSQPGESPAPEPAVSTEAALSQDEGEVTKPVWVSRESKIPGRK